MVDELVQRGYRVTWLTHGHLPRRPDYPSGRVGFLSRWSIRGHWHYLRSNLVLYTHGLYGFAKPVPGKVVVNLWHGMPVKQIGIPDGQPAMSASFSVATCSEVSRRTHARVGGSRRPHSRHRPPSK